MQLIDSSVLIPAAMGLYLLAAICALALGKSHKAANILPNAICMLSAAAGILASLDHLIEGHGAVTVLLFKAPIPNVSMNLNFDSTSAFFLLGLSVLVFCVSLYSMGYISHYYGKRNVGLFNFLYSGFILSILLVFISANMVTFLISWEAMSLISYFLVVFESEHKENQRAGTLYIIMTHVGTAFLILAFILMYHYTGSFDLNGNAAQIPGRIKDIIFILLLIGFGTKAGIVPLHIWLPSAHPAASSNVSAIMSGIMIKTAIYGLVRFLFGYLGVNSLWWGLAVLLLGAVSCFLGVAYALMEHNIKRLLAYHSIENIGIIMIGLGVSMIAYNQGSMFLSSLALLAALFHTFNHALFKGGLFLGAGAIQYSTHTKDIEELGGLIKKMPYTAVFMLCFSMAICAIVPFNGFASEWLTYQSLFMNIGLDDVFVKLLSILSAAVLAIAGALALACFVKLFGISFLGKPRSAHSDNAAEVPVAMRAGMALISILCLLLGIFPLEFIKVIDSVPFALNGTSVAGSLQGSLMFLYYPINIGGNSVMPVWSLVLAAAVIVLILAAGRLAGGKLQTRKYGTWDCGYGKLTPRMQYTATGFSKPVRIVFRMLYRPGRELQVKEGASPYYPHSMKYTVSTEKVFEKYMYYPMLDFIRRMSKWLKFKIQTGSIHMYLLYIFIAVLGLMLYNSLTR